MYGLSPDSQEPNVVLTVVCVPSSLEKLIKTGPEFRFVKQLVLVQIVKLGDFKTPISF